MPYVFDFDHKHARPPMELKDLLGGKGANLAEMTSVLGLPVPPGFTISTDTCRDYMAKGWPKSLDHESYVLGFVACLLTSVSLLVYAQRMQADVRTWQYLLQLAFSVLGLLLLGIAGGCGIGIFTCRFRSLSAKPPE